MNRYGVCKHAAKLLISIEKAVKFRLKTAKYLGRPPISYVWSAN